MKTKGTDWIFLSWEGPSYTIVNSEVVPGDTYSEYRVKGVLSIGEQQKMKITKVSIVKDDWSPEFNTIY
jgi:hypothetical protein